MNMLLQQNGCTATALSVTTTVLAVAVVVPFVAYWNHQLRRQNNNCTTKSKDSSYTFSDHRDSHHGTGCCNMDLKEHTKIFKRQIMKIQGTDNVYIAIGYSLANCIIIDGDDDGIIIIDTTETEKSAQLVLDEFRKMTGITKPVAGIILTHFHTDHVGGTDIFLDEAKTKVVEKDGMTRTTSDCPIWAHETTGERISQFNSIMGPIAYVRAAKMYGLHLERPSFENCGIGPFLNDDSLMTNPCCPTHTYNSPKQTIVIAGVELQLIHAPGETDDQTVVYMPQHDILFAADNYYESFPNLYTIRGAPNRDVIQWAASLDTMIQTQPKILVPSHTLPVYGAEDIRTRLQNYRDAIQYVHDQTVRLMLKNYHPDEIAASIKLPSHLRQCEYLKEFYGTVGWSAKAIFDQYMGWYSGDECDLQKLTPTQYAHRLIDLAGGNAHSLLEKARHAYENEDYQWGLELATAILRVDKGISHNVRKSASDIKAQCCTRLGERQISANGRNWYLTCALQTQGRLSEIRMPNHLVEGAMMNMPLALIFNGMSVRFCPITESSQVVTKSLCFILKHDELGGNTMEVEGWTLIIRNCVLYSSNIVNHDADVVIETTESTLRQFLVKPAKIIASNIFSKSFVAKKGSIPAFLKFMMNIERSD